MSSKSGVQVATPEGYIQNAFKVWGVDLTKEHKAGCPRCTANGRDRSSDNLHVYGLDVDELPKGAHCFSCGFTIVSYETALEEGYIVEYSEEELLSKARDFNADIYQQIVNETADGKKLRDFGITVRGVRGEIYGLYGIRHQLNEKREAEVQMYPTFEKNEEGKVELVGYRCRLMPKTFVPPFGRTGKDCMLFGQKVWEKYPERDRLLIVAGEIDVCSATQMLKDYAVKRYGEGAKPFHVVCSTSGEASTAKQIAKNYDYVSSYNEIIVLMDNDEAGEDALEAIAEVLPKGKMRVMRLAPSATGKKLDANDYLMAGREQAFISAFYSAVPYAPKGIMTSCDLASAIREAAAVEKVPLPDFLHKLREVTAGGIPLGRIVNIGSMSGAGKSTIVDELLYFWIFNSPHDIAVVSLEADAGEYGTKLLSRHVSRKIELFHSPQEKLDFLSSDMVLEKEKDLFWKDTLLPDGSRGKIPRFYLIDDRSGSIKILQEKVEELIVKCGVKVIMLDPLQDLLDGLSNEEQAVFMGWQKEVVKRGVTFINVNHVRKSGNGAGVKANSAGAELYEEDFQGSSAIFKSGALNILLMRNKEAESELDRNTTFLKVTKCRWTGKTSPRVDELFYYNEIHRMFSMEHFARDYPAVYAPLKEEKDRLDAEAAMRAAAEKQSRK